MPPLTCCVLCSSPIWTCDPYWPSYYRGITLFSIKRVQRFCLFRILLHKWSDLNRWPKVLSIPLLYPTELHFVIIIIRMTCSTVRWLHLYPYYLLSSYRTSPTMIFNLLSFTYLYFPSSNYQSFLNSLISGQSGRYPIWHMNYHTWYSLRLAVFGRYPQYPLSSLRIK